MADKNHGTQWVHDCTKWTRGWVMEYPGKVHFILKRGLFSGALNFLVPVSYLCEYFYLLLLLSSDLEVLLQCEESWWNQFSQEQCCCYGGVEQEFSINLCYLRPQVVISIQHQEPNDSDKSTCSLGAVLGRTEGQLEDVQVVSSDIFQNIAAGLAWSRGNGDDQAGLGTLGGVPWVSLCELGKFPQSGVDSIWAVKVFGKMKVVFGMKADCRWSFKMSFMQTFPSLCCGS